MILLYYFISKLSFKLKIMSSLFDKSKENVKVTTVENEVITIIN